MPKPSNLDEALALYIYLQFRHEDVTADPKTLRAIRAAWRTIEANALGTLKRMAKEESRVR
jgi:hypothetical protein